MSNQRWSSYIGCRSSTELHTSCVCSCTTSTSDSHHNTCQTVSTASEAGGRYRLKSTGSAAYVLPRTRTRFGERGFFYSGPAAWNTLPSDLHDITDTSTFRKRLKNVLFDRAYHWLLLALLDVSYSGALQILRWLIWLTILNKLLPMCCCVVLLFWKPAGTLIERRSIHCSWYKYDQGRSAGWQTSAIILHSSRGARLSQAGCRQLLGSEPERSTSI